MKMDALPWVDNLSIGKWAEETKMLFFRYLPIFTYMLADDHKCLSIQINPSRSTYATPIDEVETLLINY